MLQSILSLSESIGDGLVVETYAFSLEYLIAMHDNEESSARIRAIAYAN